MRLNVVLNATEKVMPQARYGEAPGEALLYECINPELSKIPAVSVDADRTCTARRTRHCRVRHVTRAAVVVLPPDGDALRKFREESVAKFQVGATAARVLAPKPRNPQIGVVDGVDLHTAGNERDPADREGSGLQNPAPIPPSSAAGVD